jgi:hypothetical protein
MVVFMLGGFHVPLIPFVEVAGSAGGVEFWQSGPMLLKTGVTGEVTVTVIEPEVAHWPVLGVNR